MSACKFFRNEPNFLRERGVCYGTKEKEPCSCGGDKANCDFYVEVRRRAKKPVTNYDSLISKTPEELALWMHNAEGMAAYCGSADSVARWLDWLKSPVEGKG